MIAAPRKSWSLYNPFLGAHEFILNLDYLALLAQQRHSNGELVVSMVLANGIPFVRVGRVGRPSQASCIILRVKRPIRKSTYRLSISSIS